MKEMFRNELFAKIQAAMASVPGKQKDIAGALGVNQNDVSMIKRGMAHMFSTDKLIDIATKCGWSFSFSLVEGDGSALAGIKSKADVDLGNKLAAMFGGEE